MESILDKELPLVKERVPSIASGPFYRGVSALGVDLSVTIDCGTVFSGSHEVV